MEEAVRRGRRVGVLFVDLEAQYSLTIKHIADCYRRYALQIEPFWVALPMHLRNAVSMYQPHWICWDPKCRDDWVRDPPETAIVDSETWAWFRPGMEFEEFVIEFGRWYSDGQPTACLVGIRTDESLNRYRSLAGDKSTWEGLSWTTWKGRALYNAYPIYDWRAEDIWTYHAQTGLPYNALYDRMHKAGLSIHEQRICQPYGDDQRKGLWLYQIIEPETWGRVLARVNGANSGALYARESGNILGRLKIALPPGHTWESFAKLILETMPPHTREHYANKIAVFLKWWQDRGFDGGIPDVADPNDESARKVPSWRRVCKALLRHDYWCKGLSFSQTKSASYERYMQVMQNRRRRWGLMC